MNRLSLARPLFFGLTIALLAMGTAVLTGCASSPQKKYGKTSVDRNASAPTLTINQDSRVQQVLDDSPMESLMEHFDAYDAQGRLISYISYTDTDVGGVLFVDGRLQGSLTRDDVQAYYACRGHAMISRHYWAANLHAWLEGLLARVRPETSVLLEFSGKSTVQSIKEATENPVLGRLRSLLGMGTNPLSIFSTLNSARSDYDASEQFKNETAAMNLLKPGMGESRLADIAVPQDLGFLDQGTIMAYPTHRVEYFIVEGQIRVIQQPALYTMSRLKPAVFYLPDVQWSRCNSKEWMYAVPKETHVEKAAEKSVEPVMETPAPVPSPSPAVSTGAPVPAPSGKPAPALTPESAALPK